MIKSFMHSSLRIFAGILLFVLASSFSIINPPKKTTEPKNTGTQHPNFFRNKNITDGPYIFYENNKVVVKWIKGEHLIKKTLSGDNTKYLRKKFGLNVPIENIKNPISGPINFVQQYKNIDNVVVISDVHGQFDLFTSLLKDHKVINANLDWIFETGHLVVLGDIFDRGPKVTELLWLVYQLEQQAEKAGGKVHFILGNHELMVLNNDLRYINEKYIHSSHKMNMVYTQLFAENTFFGQWLRSKPVMVTINDLLFVHAGISDEFLSAGLTIEKTNQIFYEKIIGKSWDLILNDSISTFMLSENGPLWHRGYFKEIISDNEISNILSYFDSNYLIIGHTSMPNIMSLKSGKIIIVDSGIKEGIYGEILIYKKNEFFRGTSNGMVLKLEPQAGY